MARKPPSAVALAIKRKRKPRGRPFSKGNKIGPRFLPGRSGNPSGRPKDIEGVQALLVSETIRQSAEIVEAVIRKAIKGSAQHAGIVFDRVLGKVPQPVEAKLEMSDERAKLERMTMPELKAELEKTLDELRREGPSGA